VSDDPTPPPSGPTPQEIMAARRKIRLGADADDRPAESGPEPISRPAAPPTHHLEGEPTPEPERDPDPEPLLIANCSGFYGDRLSAAREMVEGGPIDVLTGDWLAELTMLILAKGRAKHPDLGFATTFLTQMEQVLGRCLADGIVVVSNAGGLNPAGCAEALQQLADRLGLTPQIAYVAGDDLLPRLDDLRTAGIDLRNLDTGQSLDDIGVQPVTANAYLGGWGICEALNQGADVVITGRVTDAAVTIGPTASRFGWGRTDWDRLAGAVVAGHVIECGAQCTGGNFAFFEEVPGLERPGFPIAEIYEDGQFVVTKHPGTGGRVSIDTVTAQLLYEIQGLGYYNPDVVVAYDTINLTDDGPDRVRVSGVVGLPAPETTKVAINYEGGYRNSMTFVLTGLDIEAKAELAERTLWSLTPGGKESFATAVSHLRRTDHDNPATNDEALAELRITVMDADKEKVGRAFSNAAIEMVLANYPGLFTTSPPGDASSFGVYWPALVPDDVPEHTVVLGDRRTVIERVAPSERRSSTDATVYGLLKWDVEPGSDANERAMWPEELAEWIRAPEPPDDPTAPIPLGRAFGARSGDKGGNANIGVWARRDDAYAWLHRFLTVDQLRQLMPVETLGLQVRRYELPSLRALNFVVVGLLGKGVAASTRVDPQAKGLGEYLRAKVVDLPTRLLVPDDDPRPPLDDRPPPPT
jgi:hypothetical protein